MKDYLKADHIQIMKPLLFKQYNIANYYYILLVPITYKWYILYFIKVCDAMGLEYLPVTFALPHTARTAFTQAWQTT